VSLANAALAAAYPDYAITVINMGIAGDTAHDLRARWDTDVLALRPDWLVVKIGINDAFRIATPGVTWGRSSAVEEYEGILDDLISRTRAQLDGLVLMTPYILEPDRQDPLRLGMDAFGAAVGKAAARHDALLVDTQAAFDSVMGWIDPLALAADRIHVNLVGHMVLARAFLRGIEFSWERMPET
jgi:lysophospholipase L1-like esterase